MLTGMTAPRNVLERVYTELERWGLCMQVDNRLPSVTRLVAGEAIQGSWWGHPKGHLIFAVLEELDDSEDVTFVKLVSTKITLVHRKLWPELLAVASSREPWQLRGLSKVVRDLLAIVQDRGKVRVDALPGPTESKRWLEAARDLERRLLVHTRQEHTESGVHARVLQTWAHWRKNAALRRRRPPVRRAQEHFERILSEWHEVYGSRATLPWAGKAH